MAKFSLRIVDADYYISKPKQGLDISFSDCRQKDVFKVPTIRIFGATPQGQKVCLHIHNVFPYFYVLIPEEEDRIKEFSKRFAASLDTAIQLSLGKAISKQQDYVYSYEVVDRMYVSYYYH